MVDINRSREYEVERAGIETRWKRKQLAYLSENTREILPKMLKKFYKLHYLIRNLVNIGRKMKKMNITYKNKKKEIILIRKDITYD